MNKPDSEVSEIYHDSEVARALSYFGRSRRHQYALQALIENAQKDHQHSEDLSAYDGLIRARLSKAVFVGHINTDLDSVAGAIGAAALFGGTPAINACSKGDVKCEFRQRPSGFSRGVITL